MNRYKKIYILLGVLAVVCLAAFGATRIEEYKEQIKNSDEIILELSADSVQTLSWEYDGESFAFHKDEAGEAWLYDADEAFPVDAEEIAELLEQFEAFGVSFIIEDVEDYGQYGLDDATCSIWITAGEESYEILLGDYSTMDEKRYVSIGDGNVYLVENDPLDYFDAQLSDLIKNDETPYFDTVSEITFSGAENYSIVYKEDSGATYCADDVYFVQSEDGGYLPLDSSNVDSWLNVISRLSLTEYVTYNATDEELKEYGLDAPGLVAEVKYVPQDGDAQELLVLNINGVQEEDDGEVTAYLRVGESQIVYSITESNYEKLTAVSYNELRHAEVLTADFADITQLDISLEDETYTITSQEDDDGERVYFYGEEELDISTLESALESLTADSFTDEDPSQKEEISLTVYLENENYPTVQIALYRYDGSECLAVVDGEPLSLVSRADTVTLIEAVNAIVLGSAEE